eukprot:2702665-Pyramimonas_sp.AAC.1
MVSTPGRVRNGSRTPAERGREMAERTLPTVQRNPLATRPLGTLSRLGFQQTLRRSVASTGKSEDSRESQEEGGPAAGEETIEEAIEGAAEEPLEEKCVDEE